MKKNKKMMGAVLTSLCLAMASPMPILADSQKVVTLGADLSDEQKDRMLRYFQVDPSVTQILTITNQDEREHLGSFVPLEQIGTRTVSCAYVQPTMSGGIKVRTANLNWVTSNRIATTLSTSGVVNCQVIAAAPFEVSGTGALTGIMMAYESASGEKLDETKKELATEEMVVTGNLASDVGNVDATAIVNEAKMQVIEGNVQQAEQIQNIVTTILEENHYEVSQDKLDEIVSLLQQIAQQNYDYEQMKETLERVEENVTASQELPDNEGWEEVQDPASEEDSLVEAGDLSDEDSSEEETMAEEDILSGLDESILGEDVIASSTDEPEWEEPSTEDWDLTWEEEWDETWEETDPSEDTDLENPDEDVAMDGSPEEEILTEEVPAEEINTEDISMDEFPSEDTPEEDTSLEEIPSEETPLDETLTEDTTLTPDNLDEGLYSLYSQAQDFCRASYKGDGEAAGRLADMGLVDSVESVSVGSWDAEVGEELTNQVLQAYLEILYADTDAYEMQEGDIYFAPELNMLNQKMKELFGVDTLEADAQDVLSLAGVSEEERQLFYEDTMAFFSTLYGESEETYAEMEEIDETLENADEALEYVEEDVTEGY
ncbi:MAG: DUF1002 domain-containing protein [Eubacteriales bacterium]|nr:DUF1002 domain-containing protein [Eubacteriales bacterium]